MLFGNNVINLEGQAYGGLGHAAVFAAASCPCTHLLNQGFVHWLALPGAPLERLPGLGLHDCQKVTNLDESFEIRVLLLAEFAATGLLGERVHEGTIRGLKV
jgi:hypothetical protein